MYEHPRCSVKYIFIVSGCIQGGNPSPLLKVALPLGSELPPFLKIVFLKK
jgi:hypothetical protein